MPPSITHFFQINYVFKLKAQTLQKSPKNSSGILKSQGKHKKKLKIQGKTQIEENSLFSVSLNKNNRSAYHFKSCRFITVMRARLKVPAKNSPALLFLSRGKAADCCCFSFFFFSPAEEEQNFWRELSNACS